MDRQGTYKRLTSAKKLGLLGALALIFNTATGPGLPFTPSNFQSPGVIFTLLCFLVFTFISGFSILFIVEAMQAIPGNKHFQGDVEYATLINFYFPEWAHIVGQICLYGALQSNAIQSIILSAQAIDQMFIDIFGKSCGVSLSGSNSGWICVASRGSLPSPFGDRWMLLTLGLLVVMALSIPLGLTNIDDNLWVQYGAFVFSIIMVVQWNSTAIIAGLDRSRIPAAVPFGLSYGQVLGTVMLNLAVTTIIPSWINIKSKDVNVQKTVWLSMSFTTLFYVITGLILASGFSEMNSNVLSSLLSQGMPQILTKVMVYLFAFVMLIPAIPVNLIISKNNLYQNEITSDRVASFLSFVVPWLICIPLQTGNLVLPFQTWTSSIFVSTSNFIIPVIIYFKCVAFRSKYNIDRELSAKQLDLLKRIHAKSSTLVKLLGRKKKHLVDIALEAPVISVNTVQVLLPIPLNESLTDNFNQLIEENVPDPDMEDIQAGRFNSKSIVERFTDVISLTLGRNANKEPLPDEVPIEVIPLEGLPVEIESEERTDYGLLKPEWKPLTGERPQSSGEKSPSILEEGPSQMTIKAAASIYSLLDVQERKSFEPSTGSSERLGRMKTLPTHPKFKSPAFRSVPLWAPLRGYSMAWIVLVVTVSVTAANIIFNVIPS